MKTARISAILIFLFTVMLPCIAMAAAIGKITAIEGDVDVLKPGMERAAPAALQQPVSEGDIVRTKSNAKAEITFVDDSIIRLAPGSRLQITEYLLEGSKRKSGVMNLFRGKVRAVVSKSRGFLGVAFGAGDRFEVRTPTAVAGVKGTDFFVSYNMGVTGIVVKEGRVDAFNPAVPGQIVPVSAGNATFISENKPPSTPRPATDVEVIRHTKDTDTGEKPKEKKDETSTITASAGGPPAGGTFGYTSPGGAFTLPPTGTETTIETVVIPPSETHPGLLSDITPPVIGIAGPTAFTNQSTANFTVTTNETANITYTMDGWGATSPNTTSDSFSITGLAEGPHILIVTATDAAGNKATQTYSFTADYTPPVMTGVSGPAALTNSSSAAFGFTANEAASSYSYSLDGGATWVSTGSSLNLSAVPGGANTIKVRVTDLAGNTSVASLPYSWTTDYTPPASLTLTGTPASLTNINSATIGASATDANGVTYSYTLDGAPSTGTLTGLTEGSHTFTVIATDGAGNISTQTYTWTTDYTAPVVSITPAALPDTGINLTKIGISLSSSESSTYSYSLDGGAWTAAAASFNLTGLANGSHTLGYTATDAAGNTSATGSLSFDLTRYALAGNVSDTSGGISGSITLGEVAGVSNQSWGGWNIGMAGTYTSMPSSFTLNAGGTSYATIVSNSGGYWIEVINGTSDGVSVLSGTSNLKYLSYDRLGKGTGTMTGSYDGFGNWSATDSGAYTETPLAFSGNIGYDYNDWGLYTVDGLGINGIGDSYGGLLGGIVPSLSNPTSITYIGPYNDFGANLPSYIWTPVIYSGNGSSSYAPSYDGNEFWGYIGGRWQNRTIDGRVYSLYIDSSGNAGILKGSLAGAYYPELGKLQADGTWAPIQLSTGVSQASLTDLTYSPDWYWSSTIQTFTSSGYLTSGASPLDTGMYVAQADGRKDSIAGQDWGIWQTILGGTYTTYDSPDGFNLSTEVIDSTGGKIAGTNTDGQWSNGKLTALLDPNNGTGTFGYGADITNTPMTWISVGETIGTFDPVALSWQAVQTGAWLDTNKFLAMTQTAQGQAALTALNIPFAEVGRANLTGSNADWTINMNNTTFFAYSNGAPPKIWATGDVNGSYSCSACGATPALTGNGLTANLNMQTWDTVNNKWLATVNGGGIYSGTGTMNGTNVQMTGAAAGTNTGIGPGTFSGTAAGTAK